MITIGYKASAEQFGPRELLDFACLAETVGFDSVFVSDHFQPWRHTDGHAPFSFAWLGALGARIFSAAAPRLPNTVFFAVPDIDGETLVGKLDRAGFACASGSACSSQTRMRSVSSSPSRVIPGGRCGRPAVWHSA